ncbi:MAG: dockerin type I repeat-containing protein, partial [Planctomycetota bacterium]
SPIAVGGCALAPVEDLVCFESGGDVLLFWTNGDLYGDVEVLRDGIVIATLTGAPIAYSDVNPGDGLFRYEVRGIAGPECSPAEACDVVVGVVDLIFAHPDQAGGGTDSAAAIEAALSGLGRTPALRPELPDANLLADLSTIWLVLGTFPDKHILTAAEGTALFEASSSLDGVLVVMEGGDTWADDPPTAFHDLTGAVGTGGGSADLGTILGLDSGVGADLSTVTGPGGVPYGGENQSIDHLEPDGSPGAGLIFQNLANGDPVGVYHDAWLSGIGGFQGIATSFEIGGFGSASDQLSLMVELLAIQASSCAGMIYAPVNLVAGLDAAVGEVHLEWSNSGVYDTLEVLRNGAVIHFDPLGADISAVDGSPEVGLNEYVVRATVGPVCFAESAPAEVNVPPPPSGEFVRGDANGSGLIDIADAVFLLAFLFSNGDPPPCDDAADVNDDGMIDISDPVNLLAFLFSNGPPPPPPHPDCGVDPTDDLLDCVEFLPCP